MIRVEVGDLAFIPATALVRPATTLLEPTTTLLRNLEQVAGPSFARQIRPAQALEIGAATVTAAGELEAEFVIHAIISSPTEPVTRPGVDRALKSVMQRAVDWEFGSVALPPVGTGAGNLSLETAADVMAEVILMHQQRHSVPNEFIVVVASAAEQAVFEAAFGGNRS